MLDISREDLGPEGQELFDRLIHLRARYKLNQYWTQTPSPGVWGMTPPQEGFHRDPSKRRMFRAANKTGKTTGLSAEIWAYAIGDHPFRDTPEPPVTIIYIVANYESGYVNDVCRSLRELEPPGVLHARCSYDQTRGYTTRGQRKILLDNGSEVIFLSGKGDVESLMGLWGDLVVINEPPRETHWGEAMRIGAQKNAPVIIGFTPMDASGNDLKYLRRVVEGDPRTGAPPKADWSQHRAHLIPDHVPHRDWEAVEEQLADIPEWEWEQRTRGDWDSASSDRRIAAFDKSLIVPGDQHPLTDWPYNDKLYCILAADHGEKAGASAWGLFLYQVKPSSYDRETGRTQQMIVKVRMCGEYVSSERFDEHRDTEEIVKMVKQSGLSMSDIDWAVGDINRAGRSKGGRLFNDIYEECFTRYMRLPPEQPAFHVYKARKGPGSVDFGLKRLNQACARADFTVSESCPLAIEALSKWSGDEDELEHRIDMIRYAQTSIEYETSFGEF